jgi:hypothetical protein
MGAKGTVSSYHEAQISPLVQEVSIDIDAIGLTEVLGDERTNRGEVLFLEGMFILYISQI